MPTVEHFVLVDFENVPKVDLALVEGRPVHVILLIGKHQKKLETSLSLQLHRHASQVTPAEVGASGRNALDLTLAYYLGQAVKDYPHAKFHIVSKDKDFEPLLAHLKAKDINVARHDAFAALPFLQPPKPPAAGKSKPPFKVATANPPASVKAQPASKPDKFAKFVSHLRNSPPSSKTKLEHMITAFFKPTLPVGGMKGLIKRLQQEKILSIDPDGKVTVC